MAKVKFWEEAEGEQSATRLVFIVGSFWLMGITTVLTMTGQATLTEGGIFFSTQFALLAGAKVWQKGKEAKPDEPINPNVNNEL